MIFKQLNRLQQIDQLIRQKRTGSADDLANKLRISRRQVYYLLDELKVIGLEIEYKRAVKSFIYLKPYKVDISFKVRELTIDELINTNASGLFFKKYDLCNKIAH